MPDHHPAASECCNRQHKRLQADLHSMCDQLCSGAAAFGPGRRVQQLLMVAAMREGPATPIHPVLDNTSLLPSLLPLLLLLLLLANRPPPATDVTLQHHGVMVPRVIVGHGAGAQQSRQGGWASSSPPATATPAPCRSARTYQPLASHPKHQGCVAVPLPHQAHWRMLLITSFDKGATAGAGRCQYGAPP
jgi:hypothetical protein